MHIYIYNHYLGWALTVELLSTAFQSGPFGEDVCGIDRSTGKPTPMPLGHYFLAIDIEKLCPLDTFKANASNLLHAVRSSKKSPQGCGKPLLLSLAKLRINTYNFMNFPIYDRSYLDCRRT